MRPPWDSTNFSLWTNIPPEMFAEMKHNRVVITTNGMDVANPAILAKFAKGRVNGTLVYPNALAGSLLLLLPAMLATLWQARELLTAPARLFLMGLVGAAGLACLYWSGSKGGWLLMLLLGLIALLRLPFRKEFKAALIAVLLLAGLPWWMIDAMLDRPAARRPLQRVLEWPARELHVEQSIRQRPQTAQAPRPCTTHPH